MDQEKFSASCEKKICLRHTIISRRCQTDSKRESCYGKWCKNQSKNKSKKPKPIKIKKDNRWEETRNQVWMRDAGFIPDKGGFFREDWKLFCRVWKCLNNKEQMIAQHIGDGDFWINKNLDVSHILGRGSNADHKYDINNLVLTGRYFANLLDTHKDPVTRESITKEQVVAWWERILNQ